MPYDANDPETKAALDAAITKALKEAKTDADDQLERMQSKNRELLAELREAKKGREIDPAKYAQLEEQVAALQEQLTAAAKDAEKATKALKTQLETVTGQYQAESAYTQRLLVDNGLTDALVKAGVEATYLPYVKARMQGDVKVVIDGENRRAMVGDKALADYVIGWAQSDEGKNFVKAANNSGGGAPGNGKGGGGGKVTIASGDTAAFGANLDAIASGNAEFV